jgi:hypothetical protein
MMRDKAFVFLCAALSAVVVVPGLQGQPAPSAERIMALEGLTYAVQGGATNQLLEPLALPEAIQVLTNGTFTVKEGKERPLKEGQVLLPDGTLINADGSVTPVVDHVAMIKNRVVVCRDGEFSNLPGPMTLGDGSTVTSDGFYTRPGGTSLQLLDGLMFRLDGRPIPAKDTVMLKSGKVRVQKDGSSFDVPPDRTLMMNDGTKVFGDGTLVRMDGTTRKLSEGEIVLLTGAIRNYQGGSPGAQGGMGGY